jgi:thioredoxin 1
LKRRNCVAILRGHGAAADRPTRRLGQKQPKGEGNVSNVIEVTDGSFEQEVLKSATPVLIDFWAPWCGPCKAIAPIVEELAGEYNGKLKVMKMNVDDNPQTPSQYGVRGIPNLILFKGGTVAQQLIGNQPKAQLVKAIDSVIV